MEVGLRSSLLSLIPIWLYYILSLSILNLPVNNFGIQQHAKIGTRPF